MAGYAIPQNNATYPLIFHLLSATDGQSPVTGATATVTLSKDGAAYAAPAGAVSEIGNGDYKVAANATDANALGPLVLNATATGAAPASVTFLVVAYNPFDVNLNLARLDAAVSTRATPAQILTTPANLLATDATGKVSVGTNADKTGYALTTGEHTNVAADVQTGLTAQGLTTVRAGYVDVAISSRQPSGNVTVGGYATGQDPATVLLAAALSLNPTVGTVAESLAYARSLAGGLKVVNTGTGTIDLYAHDKTTKLVTVTLAPSLTAPTSETPNR